MTTYALLLDLDGNVRDDAVLRDDGVFIPTGDQGYQEWLLSNAPGQPIPTPQPVPTITKAQALLYLLSIGKSDADVKAAITTIADPTQRTIAEIEWEYRQPCHHDHPLFIALGPLVGISDMSAAFRIAATL